MKVTTTHTTFEFTMEEKKALETVSNLIDLIYNAMGEDERFLGYDECGVKDMVYFFDEFDKVFSKNVNVIECTVPF